MTSPEKFRRRQRIEGAFLLLLAFLSVGYGVWDSEAAGERDACMADSFRAAGEYQSERARLAEKATELMLESDALQRNVLVSFSSAESIEQFYAVLERYQTLSAKVEGQQKNLLKERENTNVPPFPDGKCQ